MLITKKIIENRKHDQRHETGRLKLAVRKLIYENAFRY